jgi:hypothetical protein
MLNVAFGEHATRTIQVFEHFSKLNSSVTAVEDGKHSGHPSINKQNKLKCGMSEETCPQKQNSHYL